VDLPRCQPCARHKGLGQGGHVKQDECMHGRDHAQHQHQNESGFLLRGGAAPTGGGGHQQANARQGPCREPEIDGFVGVARCDEAGHAHIGQHVREVQQRHAAEGAPHNDGVQTGLKARGVPGDGKDHARKKDGASFQRHVQRQVIGPALDGCRHGRHPQQQQKQKTHCYRDGGLQSFASMGRMDHELLGWPRT